jgi:ABC-type dipeptide/oligopeptide/nickel transport system permease subunit
MDATGVTLPPALVLEEESAPGSTFLRRLLRTRLTGLSIAIIILLVLGAIFARQISPYDPVTQQDYANANEGPTALHWLGTDYLGRDLLSRIIFGARVSLLVGAVSVGIGLLAGVAIGVTAGYLGGKTDSILMRLSDVIWAFPSLMLALSITAALGRGIGNAMIAIGVVNVPFFARLSRASTLAVRHRDYVVAADAIGASVPRVILRHVLPNIVAPLIVQGSLAYGVAMTTEASLDFLGVGVQPPTPSWGVDLQVGYQYLANNPSLAIFPGLAIFIAVLAFNFLGDGLRVALDPRLARRNR